MATTLVSGVQYSGSWSLSSVANAVAAGTWPPPPGPALFSWGYNNNGQLGIGNRTNYSSPKQVGSLKKWAYVAAGQQGPSFAIKNDGTLWSWGFNSVGQLGLGNTANYSSPVQVGSLANWSVISTGTQSTIAIKTDGTLWTWGGNSGGQLGLANTTNYSSPKQVGALTNWLKVAGSYAMQATMLVIKSDGTLWGWGANTGGQIGLGNRTNYSSPKQVGALTNWLNIASGYQSALATKTDGTLWSWGTGTQGVLGLGNTTSYSSPKQVGALTNWLTVAAGYYCAYAVKTDGTLWAWGSNTYGQLGLGNTTAYNSPKQVGALTTWSKLTGGLYVGAAIRTDGTLWTWGNTTVTQGMLGLNNQTNYSSPKQVGNYATWTSVGAGQSYILAIANV